jgi:hypothetical protein
MAVGDTVSTAPEVLSYPVHTYPGSTSLPYPAQPYDECPSASVYDLARQRVESLRLPLTLLVIHIVTSIPILVSQAIAWANHNDDANLGIPSFTISAPCCVLVALTGALMAVRRKSRAITIVHLVVLSIVCIPVTLFMAAAGWFLLYTAVLVLVTLDVFTASGLFAFTVATSTLVGIVNFYSYLIHTIIRFNSINCVQQYERTAIGTQAMPSFPPQITGF